MDTQKTQKQSDGSEDESDKFDEYMDENGIIRTEEQGDLRLDEQGILTLEEQGPFGLQEQRIPRLDEDLFLELDQQGISYPQPHSDEDTHSWEEHFSFSQLSEERNHDLLEIENSRNSDIISEQHETDGQGSEDHPGVSLSLPPPLDWRPPSRDQQLDMTEDEQDRGSSEGKWEEEEEVDWSQGPSDLPYDASPVRFEGNGETSGGEEQWEESYSQNSGLQEEEPNTFSSSPSPQPMPRPWGSELISHLEGLTISPGIEDETLPESLYTDSGEGTATTPLEGRKRIASKRTKYESTSTPSRTWHADDTNTKTSKASTTPVYGRGQLNYPLPDLSKVGPRVKLPREDQIYRPPQPRRLENPKQAAPVVFKSPAEIVREVLLSSTETSNKEAAVPRTIPKEFKTPQQATELVHRLQEDYHKLLTKYAEAENTIDRLRLGAKVNLYSDPPKPSHSVEMGTVLQGSKPMEITIPKAQTATFSTVSEQHEGGSGSPAPSNPAVLPRDLTSPVTSPTSPLDSPEDITSTLTSYIDLFQQEVDQFEKLWHDGKLTPGEQQQALWELRGSLDALERQYLKAREEYLQGKQHSGAGHRPEELDPHRVLEGAIFQLGVRLDELQDKVQHSTLPGHPTELDVDQEDIATNDPLQAAPLPSAVAPTPVLLTPYPEVLPSAEDSRQAGADMASVTKVVAEKDEDLPQPLLHKHMRVETEYGTLLSTYNNFKTLPDALGLEQDEWPQDRQEDTMPNHYPQTANAEDHPQLAEPEECFLTKRVRDQPQAMRSKDHPHSVRLQGHQKVAGPNAYSQFERPGVHQPSNERQEHPRSAGPKNRKQSARAEDDQLVARPSREVTPRHVPSNRGQHGESHGRERHQPPEAGGYKASKRASSKDPAAHVSTRSPSLTQLNNRSPRSPAADLSVSGDSTRSPYSRRSSYGSKSASSLAQKEQPKDNKRTSVQDRIVSPETDSGFLGSESGRSPQLRKQGARVPPSREAPAEPLGSTTSPRRNDVGNSRTETVPRSRPHKASLGRRQQSNHWAGPSEASSPSLGPKSLSESETRGQSSESDSERDMYGDVIHEPTSTDPVLPSPVGEASRHLRNILETRTARDQAIQDLQKEVIQLRQHLENSLNRPPAQERLGAPRHSSTFLNPQEEKVPHFPKDRVSSSSSAGTGLNEPRAELPEVPESGSNQYSQRRGIYGDYTGTSYRFPGTPSNHQTRQVTVPFCERCQDHRNQSPGHPRARTEVDSSSQVPSSCPLCNEGKDSTDNHRTGLSSHQANRRSHRTRRLPPCGHWVLNHPPHVNYVQTPLIPYSPPVIYSPSSSVYVPMGYTVNELRPPSAVAPPPATPTLDLDDLLYPLNRALEAAKELKVTSRRMCHSLSSDLSLKHSLRRSCLF